MTNSRSWQVCLEGLLMDVSVLVRYIRAFTQQVSHVKWILRYS